MFGPLSLNDPFTLFLLISATVLMLGYGAGRWVNQRRSKRISAWLEPGFRSLGGNPSIQRVSRSAFRVIVTQARKPFKTVTASVILISREVLPRWLWERVHRHHDLLVLHITFRQSPSFEAEIVDPRNELGLHGQQQAQELKWSVEDLPDGFQILCPPDTDLSQVKALAMETRRRAFSPWRVALRYDAPHMLISMPMPDLDQVRSEELANMLTKISKITHA